MVHFSTKSGVQHHFLVVSIVVDPQKTTSRGSARNILESCSTPAVSEARGGCGALKRTGEFKGCPGQPMGLVILSPLPGEID